MSRSHSYAAVVPLLCCLALTPAVALAQQTSVILTASPNPAPYGQPVTLTATVPSGATGKVTFYDGVTPLGIAALAGDQARFTTIFLPPGTTYLWAYYSGDTTYAASKSSQLPQTVVAAASLGFRRPLTYTAGQSMVQVAVGDFNGDGRADLAVAAISAVYILLGNGDGTFQPAVQYPRPADNPRCIAVGDFNGDGKQDLAVANYNSATVSIFLGNGDGTFQQAVYYAAANFATALVASDFNGDGIIDLATANYSGGISVLLGNGDGTFRPPVNYSVSFTPQVMALGDFNGDGVPDLIVGGYYSGLSVFLGKGDGTFQPAINDSFSGSYFLTALAVGDFNGDGKTDVAIGISAANVFILPGKGDGTFQPAVSYQLPAPADSLLAADFNGDGKLDLAASELAPVGYSTLQLLPGNGDGTFQTAVSAPVTQFLSSLAMADFNGDGIPDLAGTESNTTSVDVFLGGAITDLTISESHGSGFTQGQTGAEYTVTVANAGDVASSSAVGVTVTLPSGFTATAMAGNGWTCVVATLACVRSDSLAPGAAYPPITVTVNVSTGVTGNVTSTATVSGGGDQNLSNNTASDTSFVRFLTSITLSTSPGVPIGQPVSLYASLPAAATGKVTFFDGTNILGVASAAGGVASMVTSLLLPGNHSLRAEYDGDSNYGPAVSPPVLYTASWFPVNGVQPYALYKLGFSPGALVVGDFNRDGKADLVTLNRTSYNSISIILGNGDGTFRPAVSYPVASTANLASLVVGDFNGDGNPDIVVADSYTDTLYLMLGNGDGTFQAASKFGQWNYPYAALAAGDFNGDGKADLVAFNNGSILLLLGNGDGTFQAPLTIATNGIYAYSLAVADVNNDGKPDLLLLSNSYSASVGVMLGNGDGTFQPVVIYSDPSVSNLDCVVVGDFNGDGKPDIAVVYWSGVALFPGNGNGTFQSAVNSTLSNVPNGFAIAADFNGDGKLDIGYVGYTNQVNIAFGNGDGTFQPGVPVQTDSSAQSIAVADFNGDGKLDFAVSTSNLDIFLSGWFSGLKPSISHTGNFTAGKTGTYQIVVTNLTYSPTSVAVTVTAAVAGLTTSGLSGSGWSCNVATITCTRSDALQDSYSYPPITWTVSVPSNMTPGTVTGWTTVTYNQVMNTATDATLIVAPSAVTLSSSPDPSVLGQPVTLTAAVTAGATGSVQFLAGAASLGSASISGSQAVLVTRSLPAGQNTLLAAYSGDGTHAPAVSASRIQTVNAAQASGFGAAAFYATGTGPAAIASGDFNRDGKMDLVTANATANTVSVLLGNGDGTFRANVDYPVGTKPQAVVVADFNNDGKPDIAVANQTGNTISILLGNGDGTFQAALTCSAGNGPYRIAASDFNGDGKIDLIVYNSSDETIALLLGNGDGTFQAPNVIWNGYYSSLAVADVNGDGKADIIVGGYEPGVFLGNGDGTFQTPMYGYYAASNYPTAIALGDLNNDGKVDLVLADDNTGVYVYLGNGIGTFQPPVHYLAGSSPASVVIADVNGDGKLDVVTANYGANTISVLLGNGDGTLQSAVSYNVGSEPSGLVAGDFNGDGRTDLAVSNFAGNNVSVYLGVLTPILTVASSHQGSFCLGQVGSSYSASYSLVVTNQGPGASSGLVTVTDTLPSGLTVASLTGSGWSCNSATLACARTDSLASGAAYPPIVLTVNIAANAPSSVTNQVIVFGGGSPGGSASDPTTITVYTPGSPLQFVPVTPCRVMDTRNANGPLGGPYLAAGVARAIPVPSACSLPSNAAAYSLNITVVPRNGTLGYLTVWPAGQPQPLVSTLNSLDGSVIANAAIVPAGTAGAISAYAMNDTDLVIDVNGYFVPPASSTLQFYPLTPCRVLDTRNPTGTFGGPALATAGSRSFPIQSSSCGVPAGAAAYSLNVTVVPHGTLGYLTVWPTGQSRPVVSTLNSLDGTVLANAAIVPAGTGGAVSFYAANATDVVVDINGYFAPPSQSGLNFYTVIPNRVVDTRNAAGTFGGPILNAGASRSFPLSSGACGMPSNIAAYSLNVTAVPAGFLGYLTVWPDGTTQPLVSTLNAFKGQVVANAAILPAGSNGAIDVYVTNASHVIIDANGYFGQ